MASTGPGPRPAAGLLAGPAAGLPWWRDRLERLWRRQVEEIIELSLAYHDTASADRGPGLPGPAAAAPDPGRRQKALARAAAAHHALAEIEAALARIDAASYGACELCGARLRAGWPDARPQRRYCPRCRPPRRDRRNRPRGGPGPRHHGR